MDGTSILRWAHPASDVCRDRVWGKELRGSITREVADFKASSDKGCAACAMLLQLAEEFKPGWVSQHRESAEITLMYDKYFTERRDANALGCTGALGVLLTNGDARPDEPFQVLRQTEDDLYHPRIDRSTYYSGGIDLLPLSLQIVHDSGSEEAFVRASKWLSFCLEQDDCCRVNDTEFRPRRLLCVGSLDDGKPRICLFEPEKVTAYACLSYCWGTDSDGVLRTTTENLASHLGGIGLESLPKTISDAVIVCRNLKIPNLWVDSLCIIQDDADDWALQSSVMGEIYAKCQLAIYAKDPQSCKLGFLGHQRFGDPVWRRAVSTQLPPELGLGEGKLLIRMEPPQPERTSFALDGRGWCLQESLLPNRRLIFTGDEMMWQCCSRYLCECGHSTKDLDYYWNKAPLSSMKEILALAKPVPAPQSMRHSHSGLLEDWEQVVIEYSARELSDEKDKLSAIAGLAKLVLGAINTLGERQDSYLAGLWSSNFVTGLTWQTSGGKRQIKYRAPTWSWASIDGAVTKFQHRAPETPDHMSRTLTHVEVVEVVCMPEKESDPTGRLEQGTYAALRGPVAKVQLVTIERETDRSSTSFANDSSGGTSTFVHNGNLSTYQVEIDCPTGPYLRKEDQSWQCRTSGIWRCEQLESGEQRASGLRGSLCCDPVDKRDEYACLRLVTWSAGGEGKLVNRMPRRVRIGEHVEPQTCFLVLQKLPGEEKDVYTRVGIGFCSGSISGWTRPDGSEHEQRNFDSRDWVWDQPKWAFPLFEHSETKSIKIF